ncbi:MutS-related protein [Dyadobacter tibetensis]|uniref:MutS-related protein n=1 Tax=Dyadobacter tibetensis TaxID=1211851 RepID=UPI0004B29597|nr:DNA mismatch repair protein MutS [Dyadobacter tibetensis]
MTQNTPEIDPSSFFQTRLNQALSEEKIAQKRFNLLATLRLTAFLGAVLSGWAWHKTDDSLYGGLGLILFIAFLMLMRRQQEAKRKRDYQRNLQFINLDELGRQQFQFNRQENGEEFKNNDHPYAADLDIFGAYSLYSLLNRTHTRAGGSRLGDWLKQPAALEDILMRQEAIAELSQRPEWRQNWEATAMLHQNAGQQIGALRSWVKEVMDPNLKSALKWRFFPLLTMGIAIALLAGWAPLWLLLLSLAWQMVILKRYQPYLNNLLAQTTDLGKTMLAYAELLEIAEKSSYSSRWWMERKRKIDNSSRLLRQVGSVFDKLDFRNNPYFSIFIGIPTMWDLHCLASLEKWKSQQHAGLNQWLGVLADLEAINSLAGFAFANPTYRFPQVAWGGSLQIEAKSLGHPLIAPTSKVTNDFKMEGTGTTMLITGSNMSGKSTFLRTLGLNLVLAQTGSVVCADQFTCTPTRVFTSMRTQDSLEESTSSFYAELKRLRLLLEFADQADTVPVFYLLDEILKGTNSADRHKGAEALIKQLHHKNSAGLVSTHDLELGEWGAGQDYVENYHFRSDVAEGRLDFDYKLHPGICQSFNASELMRMMGIKIERNQDQ